MNRLRIAPEVADALDRGVGVVALESTLIAHGLPFPDNLDVASALEDAVRDAGCVPATIAILDGVALIGLSAAEIDRVARAGARDLAKASAVDMAVYLAGGHSAATTVSATSMLAERAGIRVFATGGIGGVHRGDDGDVSHDLTTLARCPVAVVSAGAKAILDLPRTLEALETLGGLVIGYRTHEWPAFYTRESGLTLDHRADSPEQLAALLHVRFDILGQGGVVIANPIPQSSAMDRAEIDAVIDRAVRAARAQGVTGKRVTPFLLDVIARATAGASVSANRALALANAQLAAHVASAYASLVRPTKTDP